LSTDRVERRLTAILAADVAEYSRLTGLDEEGTHAQLQDHLRSLVDPKIAEHRGRVVKNTGDGLLAEFTSVVDAVRCAVDVQHGMAERNTDVPQEKRIEFRIGINVGDIITDRGDIFGDGVNVAARLEGIAEPGGICVSGRVQEDVEGKLEVAFENAGEQQLKNIARPVRIYRVRLSGGAPSSRPALPLPDKPSIAVLPFQNMSGDPEQDYFADGMVEEITTALSRMRWLFVIARNSSFTYRDRAVDVKQVGRELGVRYVLEGSVRKSANRVRITGQLVDAVTGAHLWADRFDGALEDVFDLQDRVASSVFVAIEPKVRQAEIERSHRKPTESLDAYDYFLRGLASFHLATQEGIGRALEFFYKAIERDPSYGAAYGMISWCYRQRRGSGWAVDPEREALEAERVARLAVEMGKDDPVALCTAGLALASHRDAEAGAALIERALVLNPNDAVAWSFGGWVELWLRKPEMAIDHFTRSMRLSPRDPIVQHGTHAGMAYALFMAGQYKEALTWVEKVLRLRPDFLPALRIGTATYAALDRLDEARTLLARMHTLHPKLTASMLKDLIPFRHPDDFRRYTEALRKAGWLE
jgi:TolB-like protein